MTQFAAVLQIEKKKKTKKTNLYLHNTALSLRQPVTHLPSCLIHLSVNVTTSVHQHRLSQKVQAGGEANETLRQQVSCLISQHSVLNNCTV